MTRYKTIQDEVASWVENLPWLDKYETRGGRAKVSKRLVVARGLKDVIRFQEDIWQQRSKPALPSELLVEDYDSEHYP
jgi:transcription factor IIIB subunit 2